MRENIPLRHALLGYKVFGTKTVNTKEQLMNPDEP